MYARRCTRVRSCESWPRSPCNAACRVPSSVQDEQRLLCKGERVHAILGGSLTPSQRTLLPNPFLGEAFANHDTGEAPIILIVACSPRASKLAQLHSEGALHQHHPGTYGELSITPGRWGCGWMRHAEHTDERRVRERKTASKHSPSTRSGKSDKSVDKPESGTCTRSDSPGR